MIVNNIEELGGIVMALSTDELLLLKSFLGEARNFHLFQRDGGNFAKRLSILSMKIDKFIETIERSECHRAMIVFHDLEEKLKDAKKQDEKKRNEKG